MKKLIIILLSMVSLYASVVSEVNKSRFTRDGGTLNDSFSNLEWQDNKDTKILEKNWEDATAYCKKLTLNEKSDWRLPLKAELEYAFIIKNRFKNMLEKNYWTSSLGVIVKTSAWNIYFWDGGEFSSKKSNENYIRCVRGKKYKTLKYLKNTIIRTRQEKIDAKRYAIVKEKNILSEYVKFVKKYPYAKQKKEAITTIYTFVAKEKKIEDYEWFIKKYPKSSEAKNAEEEIKNLTLKKP